VPHEALVLLSTLRAPWWVAGGWALDLYLGEITRAHKDLDIGIAASDRCRRIESALFRVGLLGSANRYPPELSGGQQQRAAIARALAGSPRVLLADEPTGNLDQAMARSVMDLLQELHRDGATIVVVTHSAEMTRRAEREVRIVDGSIVQHPLLRR